MGKHWCYVLFMLWLCYLITTSILLFTRGFLLTRQVRTENSTCSPHQNIIQCGNRPLVGHSQTANTSASDYGDECNLNLLKVFQEHIDDDDDEEKVKACLPQQAQRVVLLVIDALRYDFAVYEEHNSNPLHYQNKLPVMDKLLTEQPQNTRLYKFIADPPTTTLQRLKGLTTGSLPTFIDAGSNFDTPEINEDNIIDQLISHDHNIVFMGDDTWNSLYPKRFLREYRYPSFDVWDLDTVDNGVRSHLYPELNNSDWSLLIGHFLGVDHCGHHYGPSHPEMARKLMEMNEVLKNVVAQIDEDTMLFVIGDHGMTSRGDHGGDAPDEVTSAMFVYSKRPLLSPIQHHTSSLGLDKTVKQVDLVPTLSTILGVPIPFQNLGSLLLDCLPVDNWQFALYALWTNVEQLVDYIELSKVFNSGVYSKNFTQFRLKALTIDTEEKFQEFAGELLEFLGGLRKMCEKVWVQYDAFSMARGLVFMFLTLSLVYVIVDGIPTKQLPQIFQSSFLFCSYMALGIAASIAGVLYWFNLVESLTSSIFFGTNLVSQFMFGGLIVQNWAVISSNWHDKSQLNRIPNTICRLILMLNLIGVFSNSFIVEESSVLLFLLITLILIGGLQTTKVKFPIKWPKIQLLLAVVVMGILIRMSVYFWGCREEQHWCMNQINLSKVPTTKLQWALSVLALALLVFSSKAWLRSCGNLNGYSITVTLAKYIPTVLVVCIAGYWVLQRVPHSPHTSNFQSPNMLAWTVYSLTITSLLVTAWRPLLTYVLPAQNSSDSIVNPMNIIPELFNKLKTSFSEQKPLQNDQIPIVCGLATCYSATFIAAAVYITLFFALLLGDALAPSVVVCLMVAVFLMVVTSVRRIEHNATLEGLFEVCSPNILILSWVILTQYFFYGTGHQPAFTNIQWEAAFVGTKGVAYVPNALKATLVILSTFSSQILLGFLLPVVIVVPFTIFVMTPRLLDASNTKKMNGVCGNRGELVVYEYDHLLYANVCALLCKYILAHGVRVFASMLAATIHCRHLMVWKIFAPKLIFESIGMLVTIAAVQLGFLLLIRINSKVDGLMTSLTKAS